MDASLSDISALLNRDDGFLGGGVGWIILLFIFIWAVFGGNGFGGRYGDHVTQAELQNGLYNQTTDRNLADIQMQMANNATAQASCCCNTQKAILESEYKTLLGFKDQQMQMFQMYSDLNAKIAENGYKTDNCCCSLKTQMLQDKYDDANSELMLARLTATNQVQTQNILGNLGRYVTNAPVPNYPWLYGYYYGTGTTTI